MANAKSKCGVVIAESVYNDLQSLTWARRLQGETNVFLNGVVEDLVREYVAAHKEDLDLIKTTLAGMKESLGAKK